ncbi:MAG: N-acetylglucosamine-6-phosphate deacetylase [Bacteroidales bacterium]|jgi:N-acetylglucosamine-6-phosphate deacetylase|nr:N-acetylglucosamine-6-phosphate deacetylase [Bacteroidales bacterium]
MDNKIVIVNAKIFSEEIIIKNGYIVVSNGIIEKISDGECPLDINNKIDAKGKIIIPGFIDVQVNGAGGFLVTDKDESQIKHISKVLALNGTTAYLAATSPCEDAEHIAYLSFIGEQMKKQSNGARILGVHMEGPFLNPKKSGTNDPNFVSLPDLEKFKTFCTPQGGLKLMTISPELGDFSDIIAFAKSKNVVLSMGHTTASYDVATHAINQGCRLGTHLFNTMNGIVNRDPGVVIAIADSDVAKGTIICDGQHVHPRNLNLLFNICGSKKLILITDSAPSAGTNLTEWFYGEDKIYVKGYSCYTEDGNLMGSSLTLNKAAMFAKKYMNCSTEDVIAMGATNPAKLLGIEKSKGSIKVGKDADLVILKDDIDFDVEIVMVEGKCITI